jgi:hypothetical protein
MTCTVACVVLNDSWCLCILFYVSPGVLLHVLYVVDVCGMLSSKFVEFARAGCLSRGGFYIHRQVECANGWTLVAATTKALNWLWLHPIACAC